MAQLYSGKWVRSPGASAERRSMERPAQQRSSGTCVRAQPETVGADGMAGPVARWEQDRPGGARGGVLPQTLRAGGAMAANGAGFNPLVADAASRGRPRRAAADRGRVAGANDRSPRTGEFRPGAARSARVWPWVIGWRTKVPAAGKCTRPRRKATKRSEILRDAATRGEPRRDESIGAILRGERSRKSGSRQGLAPPRTFVAPGRAPPGPGNEDPGVPVRGPAGLV